jgi:hypothetical protein
MVFIFGQKILFVRNENLKQIAALPQSVPFFSGFFLLQLVNGKRYGLDRGNVC